ncbi:MAG: glycosyltransferase family 2 protein [Clostridiales bacterium]|nr:glycosyltransferase family 2 protein [Clostridiales bacterium]
MPKISVIIPVYNVEKYLRKCLDTVINQTFSDLEIILIDDGSTDGGLSVCKEYESLDQRVHVYHKPNGGLSSARNYGIDKATGEYIGFVDSDDYISEDMYEVLYRNIITYNADISLCGLYDIYNGIPQKVNNDHLVIEANAEETIKIVMESEITSVTAVNKLYKRELFDKVRYPEGKVSEDAFVIVDLLMECNKAVITSDQKYYYIHREGSITTLKFRPQHLHVLEAYEKNYRLIEKSYPSLIPIAKMRLCWAHFNVLDKLVFDNTEEYRETKNDIIKYLKQHYLFIIKNKYFTKSRKISISLLMISKGLYKACVQLQRKRYQIEVE